MAHVYFLSLNGSAMRLGCWQTFYLKDFLNLYTNKSCHNKYYKVKVFQLSKMDSYPGERVFDWVGQRIRDGIPETLICKDTIQVMLNSDVTFIDKIEHH